MFGTWQWEGASRSVMKHNYVHKICSGRVWNILVRASSCRYVWCDHVDIHQYITDSSASHPCVCISRLLRRHTWMAEASRFAVVVCACRHRRTEIGKHISVCLLTGCLCLHLWHNARRRLLVLYVRSVVIVYTLFVENICKIFCMPCIEWSHH